MPYDDALLRCSRCHTDKPKSAFYIDRKTRGKQHYQSYCKECRNVYQRAYWATVPRERRRAYRANQDIAGQQARRRARYWQLRLEMIAAYGGKCSCCGEPEPAFLTLEHLNGGGRAHMRRLHKAGNIYKELKELGWPSVYTVLCFNCNSVKGSRGICPHEQYRLGILSRTA